MDLKIGIIHSLRDIELELEDTSDVAEQTEKALTSGAPIIWFTDTTGRRVGVVVDKLSYIEISGQDVSRTVGFSN